MEAVVCDLVYGDLGHVDLGHVDLGHVDWFDGDSVGGYCLNMLMSKATPASAKRSRQRGW